MGDLSLLQKISIWIIPVLFAITGHEVAHGWVASKLGDPTAKMLGRLSLNPLRHIDPVGTLLIPGLMLAFSPFVFGWAKPVPVTWQNLKRPKTDMIFVALAGPGANVLMALFWVLVMRVGVGIYDSEDWMAIYLIYTGIAGITINLILMVVNLLPIPPLDGGRVLVGLLPGPLAWKVSRIEPWGFFILIGLMVTGALGYLLTPVLSFLVSGFSRLGGIQ